VASSTSVVPTTQAAMPSFGQELFPAHDSFGDSFSFGNFDAQTASSVVVTHVGSFGEHGASDAKDDDPFSFSSDLKAEDVRDAATDDFSQDFFGSGLQQQSGNTEFGSFDFNANFDASQPQQQAVAAAADVSAAAASPLTGFGEAFAFPSSEFGQESGFDSGKDSFG